MVPHDNKTCVAFTEASIRCQNKDDKHSTERLSATCTNVWRLFQTISELCNTSNAENSNLVSCDAVSLGENLPTFRRIVIPS